MHRPAASDSVRPGVWLFVGAALALLGWGTYRVLARGEADATAADDDADRGGRRIALGPADDHAALTVDDQGGRHGEAHEAWMRWDPNAQTDVPATEPALDPQLLASQRTFPRAAPFLVTEERARLASVEGLPLAPGQICDVRVLPAGGSLNCLVRVLCGDTVVYPNSEQTAGYVQCSTGQRAPNAGRAPLGGRDQLPSRIDGDPEIDLDLATGRIRVRDTDEQGETIFDVSLTFSPGASA